MKKKNILILTILVFLGLQGFGQNASLSVVGYVVDKWQNPIYGAGHDNTCEFCDYYDVCSIKKEIKKREIEKLADEQVVKILEEEQE